MTLVYSAHDPEHNAAVVLRDYLTRRAPNVLRGASPVHLHESTN